MIKKNYANINDGFTYTVSLPLFLQVQWEVSISADGVDVTEESHY